MRFAPAMSLSVCQLHQPWIRPCTASAGGFVRSCLVRRGSSQFGRDMVRIDRGISKRKASLVYRHTLSPRSRRDSGSIFSFIAARVPTRTGSLASSTTFRSHPVQAKLPMTSPLLRVHRKC